MELLSDQMYADSSLVRANVGAHNLSRSGMSVDEFRNKAVEENGLFVLKESKVDENGVESERVRYFQDPKGRAPISTVDTDARWSTNSPNKRPELHYKENVIVDGGGFILARRATRGSDGDWNPAHDMLQQIPIKPKTLAADTGYSAEPFRKKLEDLDITAYIPIHSNQANSVVARMGFAYHGDHLVCPEGKTLRVRAFLRKDSSYQYVALQKDCQRCPVRTECLPPGQKRRYVALTMYHPVYFRARKRNESEAYEQEMKSRNATVEGVFASLDRLG